MKKLCFLILCVILVGTTNAQLKEITKKTFGNPDFYVSLTESDKTFFYEAIKVLDVDTSSYKLLTNLSDYFKHMNDSIGGKIVSSSYKRMDNKVTTSTYVRNKSGDKITQPVLYITYWKDPDDDYLDILIMRKF